MNKALILKNTKKYVKAKLMGEATGHDWWHVERVVRNARQIAKREGGDLFIIELAALLHDIADWKFHRGDDKKGPREAGKIFRKYSLSRNLITKVQKIISDVSFKGAKVDSTPKSLEGKVVQDADRLDALGAVGIARTFAFGGYKGVPIHSPRIKPKFHKTADEYKKGGLSTISHFYEKLLLLKDRMNTKTAKRMAKQRHEFMEKFLKDFFNEWEGKL